MLIPTFSQSKCHFQWPEGPIFETSKQELNGDEGVQWGKKILEVHANSYLMHDQNTELHKLQRETRIILLLPRVNKNSKIFMICTYNLIQRLSIKNQLMPQTETLIHHIYCFK